MIEITTGIAFLMSSLYGVGQAQMSTTSVETTSPAIAHNSNPEESFINSKVVEAYVKKQYADEPILIEVARCESTFRQFDQTGNIIRGKVNNKDIGVMQINERYHADDAAKLGYNIYTTEGNIAFGRYLYKKYGTQPWVSSSPCWSANAQLAINK